MCMWPVVNVACTPIHTRRRGIVIKIKNEINQKFRLASGSGLYLRSWNINRTSSQPAHGSTIDIDSYCSYNCYWDVIVVVIINTSKYDNAVDVMQRVQWTTWEEKETCIQLKEEMKTDKRCIHMNMTSKSAKPILLLELPYVNWHFSIFGMCKGVFDIWNTWYLRHTNTAGDTASTWY